jgi:hypothetical protein
MRDDIPSRRRVTLHQIAGLPLAARAAGAVLLAVAASPAVAAVLSVFREPAPSDLFVQRLLAIVPGCVALVAVLAFEPPRSASPLAYARQLRARFLQLQSMFDADDRRRPREGKEKEDDRVSSEP